MRLCLVVAVVTPATAAVTTTAAITTNVAATTHGP
jgi:hypothetical protein